MKQSAHLKRFVYGMAFALALGAGLWAAAREPQDAPPASSPAASGAREAAYVLAITYNREILPLNSRLIATLINSSEIKKQVVETVARRRDGKFGMKFSVDFHDLDDRSMPYDPRGERRAGAAGPPESPTETLLGVLEVRIESCEAGVTPAADAVLDVLRTELRETLARSFYQQYEKRLTPISKRFDLTRRELEVQQHREREFRAAAGLSDLSRETVTALLQTLDSDRARIEMELAGKRARRDALTRHVATAAKQTPDDVAVELAKVVAAREEELQRLQQLAAAGQAPRSDLNRGVEYVAQARAQLAQYKQQVAGGAGLAELNVELIRLAAEIADAEARLQHVAQRIERINPAKLMELSNQYEQVSRVELPRLRQAAESLSAQLQRLETAGPMLSLDVIGGVEKR